MGFGKWGLAYDVTQSGRRMGEQAVAVREQEVEFAVSADFQRELVQTGKKFVVARHVVAKRLTKILQQPAKRPFAIRLADRRETAIQRRCEIDQVTVMGENPVMAPKFADEGVRVFQTDRALSGLANMRDHIF